MFERQINRQLNQQRTRIDKQNHEAKRAGYRKIQGRRARQMKKRFDMFSGTHARRNSPSAKRYPGGI